METLTVEVSRKDTLSLIKKRYCVVEVEEEVPTKHKAKLYISDGIISLFARVASSYTRRGKSYVMLRTLRK